MTSNLAQYNYELRVVAYYTTHLPLQARPKHCYFIPLHTHRRVIAHVLSTSHNPGHHPVSVTDL
jgi:hypothetical protein